VNAVSVRSTFSVCRWQMNFRFALRMRMPGSSPDSHRIWKPLQMPSTRPPRAACARTASITTARPAMAPQRR
jgi:hypothetical protein